MDWVISVNTGYTLVITYLRCAKAYCTKNPMILLIVR